MLPKLPIAVAQMKVNDDRHGTYNTKIIKLKTTMLKSCFYDYSNVFILSRETIIVVGAGANANNNSNR